MAVIASPEFKDKVVKALQEDRKLFDGTNAQYARSKGLSPSIFSKIYNGQTERIMIPIKWIMLGEDLGITIENRKWTTARTDVFNTIEEDISFCKNFSKAKMCVDDCGIGKTYTAKYLSRTMKNCFYVDGSQAKGRRDFIREVARAVGAESRGITYTEILRNLKYHLITLTKPIIIIDEAGDLEYRAFMVIKELWNATENQVGWYLMGADGLRAKIDRGINSQKVGYAEIFSRFSEKYTSIVPRDKLARNAFYHKLITDTLKVNGCPADQINMIASQCMVKTNDGKHFFGGLRRAESLLILNSPEQNKTA